MRSGPERLARAECHRAAGSELIKSTSKNGMARSQRHRRALSRHWLDETKATREVRASAMTIRNFFLAYPDALSLLVYVDQFAAGGNPAGNALYRLRGGNDWLPERLAHALRSAVILRHVVRRITQTKSGVRITVEKDGRRSEFSATCALVTLPPLPGNRVSGLAEASASFGRLKYGPANKKRLNSIGFMAGGQARACATDLEIGQWGWK